MRLAKPTWLVVCATVASGIAPAAFGPWALAVGDPAAKAEIIAAFHKLNALPSLRIRWTAPGEMGVAEFVQPDQRLFSGKSAQGSLEIFQIGTEIRTRYDFPGASSGWRCAKSRGTTTYFDTDKMQKDTTTEVVRKPDTVIDGTPVHAYADAKTKGELYVGAQTGLPRRAVDPAKPATADLYDYGAPITITPPPCGWDIRARDRAATGQSSYSQQLRGTASVSSMRIARFLS